MPNSEDIFWFKQQFHDAIADATSATPFCVDMIPLGRIQLGKSLDTMRTMIVGTLVDGHFLE